MLRLVSYGLAAAVALSTTTAFMGLLSRRQEFFTQQRRFGIAEWRDTMFEYPEPAVGDMPTKEICVLPFSYADVLLQGETKELRLYEERFLKLFDDCMENHGGLVAMGFFMENDGLVQTVPLAEVEAYNRMGGEFGIFLTIRVVGRAKLGGILQSGPYIKASCTEIVDEISPDHELLSKLADRVESGVDQTEQLERMHHLLSARAGKLSKTKSTTLLSGDDVEEDEDDDDDRSCRLRRYKSAYEKALSSDSQGYQTSFNSDSNRTMQELTAMSWAVFNTELDLDPNDLVFKIKALDCCSLDERLKLGINLLNIKMGIARSSIEKLKATTGLNQTDSSED